MDIRVFKFLILLVIDGTLYCVLHFLLPTYLVQSTYYPFFINTFKLLMVSVAIFLLLPEDSWIWLVEESPRGRKISLRSKASKHLFLSMLYLLGIPLFPFLVALSALLTTNKYVITFTWPLVGLAALYGTYCAWRNSRNVIRHDSLFAVAWDRRSNFMELFIGVNVSKNAFFFYSGFALLSGVMLLAASIAGPILYFKYLEGPRIPYDHERYVVIVTFFHFFLVIGTWTSTMYVAFQLLFARRIGRWSKTPVPRHNNDRRQKDDDHKKRTEHT